MIESIGGITVQLPSPRTSPTNLPGSCARHLLEHWQQPAGCSNANSLLCLWPSLIYARRLWSRLSIQAKHEQEQGACLGVGVLFHRWWWWSCWPWHSRR